MFVINWILRVLSLVGSCSSWVTSTLVSLRICVISRRALGRCCMVIWMRMGRNPAIFSDQLTEIGLCEESWCTALVQFLVWMAMV